MPSCYCKVLKHFLRGYDRHPENALEIATWLGPPSVEYVNYPGLKSSSYHELATKYLKRGFGGVLTFKIKGDAKLADPLYKEPI